MSDLPKKFSFGGDKGVATPPPSSETPRKPRGFNFDPPAPEPAVPEAPAPVRRAKTFNIPTEAAPAPEPVVERKVRTLNPVSSGEVVYARRERPRTIVDILVDKAREQSPDISGEIRGKISVLLNHTTNDTLISWGQLNLVPLQQASNIQAEIANELQRINAVDVLAEARAAVTRPPSLYDRISGKKPEQYADRLNRAKDDLIALMVKTGDNRRIFAPEVKDLHHDAIAVAVCLPEFSDPVLANIANSRAKTLMQAHQTGTILLHVLETTVSQCAAFIEQIDSMVNVSIPNWKLSQQKP